MATVITLPDGTAYHEGVEFARLEILKRALASANGNRTPTADGVRARTGNCVGSTGHVTARFCPHWTHQERRSGIQ